MQCSKFAFVCMYVDLSYFNWHVQVGMCACSHINMPISSGN